MQLRKVSWDSYVWSPTFVTQETSNDRFTILKPVLPIASKRRATHYLRVIKKKNKHDQQPQPSTKQTRCSYELKRIYIYIYIYICGVHLGLLPQTSSSGLRLWIKFVFFIFISTCFGETLDLGWPWSLSLSLPLLLCMHVQFPLRVFMSFTQLRLFLSFWCILEFSFSLLTFW